MILSLSRTYFNPRSSCEERRCKSVSMSAHTKISIHAPHARSDLFLVSCRLFLQISIHAPHARSDPRFVHISIPITTFQSTLLMRGATSRSPRSRAVLAHFNPRSSCEERRESREPPFDPFYFNPRSSCEERLEIRGSDKPDVKISIHAPHARSDTRRVFQ